mmetsp:Transcript_8092/g.25863  ORF Transcript_8092/g.25863 Transcript_8092/m.25863 type:complete len:509 (+) Transcript_8092:662-2188(+)
MRRSCQRCTFSDPRSKPSPCPRSTFAAKLASNERRQHHRVGRRRVCRRVWLVDRLHHHHPAVRTPKPGLRLLLYASHAHRAKLCAKRGHRRRQAAGGATVAAPRRLARLLHHCLPRLHLLWRHRTHLRRLRRRHVPGTVRHQQGGGCVLLVHRLAHPARRRDHLVGRQRTVRPARRLPHHLDDRLHHRHHARVDQLARPRRVGRPCLVRQGRLSLHPRDDDSPAGTRTPLWARFLRLVRRAVHRLLHLSTHLWRPRRHLRIPDGTAGPRRPWLHLHLASRDRGPCRPLLPASPWWFTPRQGVRDVRVPEWRAARRRTRHRRRSDGGWVAVGRRGEGTCAQAQRDGQRSRGADADGDVEPAHRQGARPRSRSTAPRPQGELYQDAGRAGGACRPSVAVDCRFSGNCGRSPGFSRVCANSRVARRRDAAARCHGEARRVPRVEGRATRHSRLLPIGRGGALARRTLCRACRGTARVRRHGAAVRRTISHGARVDGRSVRRAAGARPLCHL